MNGEEMSNEDERAFDILKEFGGPAIELLSKPLFTWFSQIKEYQGNNEANCSFCEKPILISMLKFAIATAKASNPIFNCNACRDHEEKLSFFEDCLKKSEYIHEDMLMPKEIETF